ncbi:MAG: transcription elongation factor GreA [Actinomycetota bacterium]
MSVTSDYTISPEGLAELERELAELEGPGRLEIAARIKTAREWGDLKENGEYHAAKEAQSHMETRVLKLRDRIINAVVVAPGEAAGEGAGTGAGIKAVVFGSKVTYSPVAGGPEQTFTLVGSTEADAKLKLLSVASPVAKALMGATAGDVVTVRLPSGDRRELRVVTVA